jgi:hypothetical protein
MKWWGEKYEPPRPFVDEEIYRALQAARMLLGREAEPSPYVSGARLILDRVLKDLQSSVRLP